MQRRAVPRLAGLRGRHRAYPDPGEGPRRRDLPLRERQLHGGARRRRRARPRRRGRGPQRPQSVPSGAPHREGRARRTRRRTRCHAWRSGVRRADLAGRPGGRPGRRCDGELLQPVARGHRRRRSGGRRRPARDDQADGLPALAASPRATSASTTRHSAGRPASSAPRPCSATSCSPRTTSRSGSTPACPQRQRRSQSHCGPERAAEPCASPRPLIQTVDGRCGRSARSSSHVSSYGAPTRHVSTRFGRGLRRRGFRLTAAVKRLEHEAAEGASARTPAILVAAMAIGMWPSPRSSSRRR